MLLFEKHFCHLSFVVKGPKQNWKLAIKKRKWSTTGTNQYSDFGMVVAIVLYKRRSFL
jgi:hypothetical protein